MEISNENTSQIKPPFPAEKQAKPGLEADLNPRPRYQAPLYKASNKLEGKVALVTGGDSGIGRAVAVLYAREGADLAIVYLPEEEEDARETQKAVSKEGRKCLLLSGDLVDAQFCREAVEKTLSEFGKLDILVSNAAHQNRKRTLEEMSEEDFDRTLKTNVYAYFHLVKAAGPHLKEGSSIIATSSVQAQHPSADLPDYAATKAAIVAFTQSLAQMLSDKGVRANVVAPGPVWTPLNPADKGMSPKKLAEFGASTPMKRPAQPEEIAPAYVFLASNADSSYITGEVIYLSGGVPMA